MRTLATFLRIVLLASLPSCSNENPISSAQGIAPLVSDEVHNQGTKGFLFLAPIVAPLTIQGRFEARLPVTVRIDQIDAASTSTVGTIATFTMTTGPDSETIRADVDAGQYIVNWHTERFLLNAAAIYRIRVLLPGGRELGYADVDVVNKGSELRNVQTNEYIPLLNGKTLPIKFWVAEGVADQDNDDVFDFEDNCPTTGNPEQVDSDNDGMGDACECINVICPESDQCHAAGTCDPIDGSCSNLPVPDGTACTDGNACTQTDQCQNGACTGRNPVHCAATDLCHGVGACDPATGICSNPERIYGATELPGDAVPGTFAATGSMTISRGYDQTFTLTRLRDGRVLAAGGIDGSNTLSSAEIYDPDTGTWSQTGSMALARLSHGATLLADGKVLVTGGTPLPWTVTTSAELYDPCQGTWSSVGPMLEGRNAPSLNTLLLTSGFTLIVGGTGPRGEWLPSVELFDPTTGTFSSAGRLIDTRAVPELALLEDGRVLAVGGTSTGSSELYDPDARTWSPTGSVNVARFDTKTVRLPDGRVLMVGGQQAWGGLTAASEIYDPRSGVWTQVASLPQPRGGGFGSALLASGKVLVVGGMVHLSSDIRTDTAMLYDVATNAWASTREPMRTARSNVRGVLLRDGRFLVVGGIGRDSANLKSAEVYTP